jgi:hypothetical protein
MCTRTESFQRQECDKCLFLSDLIFSKNENSNRKDSFQQVWLIFYECAYKTREADVGFILKALVSHTETRREGLGLISKPYYTVLEQN